MNKPIRIHASNDNPLYRKLDRLHKFLQNELGLELSFYGDRIFVKNVDVPLEKEWEVVDLHGEFVNELPVAKYRLGRDIELDTPPKKSFSMAPKDMSYEVIEATD
jgi:hypothetical protein